MMRAGPFFAAAAGGLVAIGLVVPALRAEYQPKGKRDPMIPLLTGDGQRIHPPGYDEEVPTGITGLALQGIVYDPRAESYAIINGEIVREKEEVQGMKVLKIRPAEVTILAEGQEHLLRLPIPELPEEKPARESGTSKEEVSIP